MKNNLLGQFGIKDASNCMIVRKSDKKPACYIDYANNLTLESTSSTVVAKAKGQKAIVWATPTEATLKFSTEIASFGQLALAFGAELPTTGKGEYFKRELLTVSGGSVTLTETPKVGTVGVADRLDDGSVGEAYTVISGTPRTREVKLSGKTLTFYTSDVSEGATVIVTYIVEKASGVMTFSIPATAISQNYELYLDVQTKYRHSGLTELVQLQIFSATPSSSATLTLDAENASGYELSFDVVVDATKVDAKGNPKLFDFVAIDETAATPVSLAE